MFGVECFDTHDEPISHYTQWDINQTLKIVLYGMDDGYMKNAPYVHFANSQSYEALVVPSTLQGDNTIIVDIPNILLQEPWPLLVYVYLNDSTDASSQKTIVKLDIPVQKRVRPSDYEYVENIDRITAEVIKQEIYDDFMNEVHSGELKYPQVTFVDGKTGKSVNLKVSGGKIGLYVDSNAYDMLDSRDIVNNLMTDSASKVLSAQMGAELKGMIDVIPDQIDEKIEEHDSSPTSHSDIRDDISSVSNAVDTMQDSVAEIEKKIDDAMLDDTISGSGILTTTDALVDYSPIEMRIKGQTRQNLWVNPSGTQAGVTCTANEDGSVTLSGTMTGTGAWIGYANRYILRPGGTYKLSVDGTLPAGVDFRAEPRDASNTVIPVTAFVVTDTHKTCTFTVPTNANHFNFLFHVTGSVGTSLSGTYRVMLNEGSEAEPWCPPGLNSVEELSLVTAGKNLVSVGEASTLNFQLIDYFLPAGEYTFSILNKPKEMGFNLRAPRAIGLGVADDNVVFGEIANTVTFTLEYASPIYFNGYGSSLTIPLQLQLELGSTATEYEPPTVTTTSINLDGNVLHSLPDGTCDELVIEQDGSAYIEKNVGSTVVTGDVTWRGPYDSPFTYFTSPNVIDASATTDTHQRAYSDKLIVSNSMPNSVYIANKQYRDMYIREPTFADAANGVKDFFASNNMTYVFPYAEPQLIKLPPVSLPSLPSDKSNIYTTSNIPVTSLTVRYWEKSGELVANLYDKLAQLQGAINSIQEVVMQS